MNETYDVIVLGTGLSQCILASYLSLDGKKVLQIDENPYYGGESASLNLVQLTEKFKDANLDLKELNSKDWAVDLIPKFLLSNGEIVDMLHYSNIPRYVEFKQIDGTFILKNGSISKVPTTEVEALTSSLIDLAEKNRLKIFLEFIKSYVSEDVSTHQGVDLCSIKMRDLFEKFNLSKETQDIVGHSLALNQDDAYLDEIAKDTVNRISLYVTSVARFGKSPFIYPLYGLGELSQGFSRLSAVNGATFMLDTKIDEILYDEANKVTGIRSGDDIAKCHMIISEPRYFPEKVKISEGKKVCRIICFLKSPIPNTNESNSCQIILPSTQIPKRKNDIYITCVADKHLVCPKGYFIAIISTICETDDPKAECKPALDILGPVTDMIVEVKELYEPISDGKDDNVFITKSLDSTSHFETVSQDVKDLYFRIYNENLKLNGKYSQVYESEE